MELDLFWGVWRRKCRQWWWTTTIDFWWRDRDSWAREVFDRNYFKWHWVDQFGQRSGRSFFWFLFCEGDLVRETVLMDVRRWSLMLIRALVDLLFYRFGIWCWSRVAGRHAGRDWWVELLDRSRVEGIVWRWLGSYGQNSVVWGSTSSVQWFLLASLLIVVEVTIWEDGGLTVRVG